jgi:hypothetical protein
LDDRAYPLAARNFPLAQLDFRYIIDAAKPADAIDSRPPRPQQQLIAPRPAPAAIASPPRTRAADLFVNTPDSPRGCARPHKHSMARTYADVNANMPRSYWDYDSVNISWGALENYEVVRKIGTSLPS